MDIIKIIVSCLWIILDSFAGSYCLHKFILRYKKDRNAWKHLGNAVMLYSALVLMIINLL